MSSIFSQRQAKVLQKRALADAAADAAVADAYVDDTARATNANGDADADGDHETKQRPAKRPSLRVDDESTPGNRGETTAAVDDNPLPFVVRPKTAVAANLITKREKQIAKGKNTTGYRRYVLEVPRRSRTPDQPRTPPLTRNCSNREWNGLYSQWRRLLHNYDDANEAKDEEEIDITALAGEMVQ